MKNAYLVHGFNVWRPSRTVGKLKPYFVDAGFGAKVVRYGWTGLAGLRGVNDRVAAVLASLSEPGSVGVGHSNGCAILNSASHLGAKFSGLIYINPALPKNEVPGPTVKWAHVWHSPSDAPVKWAKWLRRVSPVSWFDPHPWGEMGATGYQGDDPRMHNFNKESDFEYQSKEHSDLFADDILLGFFAPLMARGAAALTTQEIFHP